MLREFAAAHGSILSEMSDVFALFIAIIVLFGFMISRFERIPLREAIYFAFITAFTVGFGDIAPKSQGARIITVVLALFGVFLMGVAVAVGVHALDIVLKHRAG